jgi:FAD/FMN-containing dehydrogenase/Fe-S oxidoreductase
MSLVELPVVASGNGRTIDSTAFERELQQTVTGEIRFDRLSRALYSTDASVYQIVPLGVVLPRSEADILAVIRACGRFQVPLTARGGGTSQAGQCIGPGVVLDCSKYLNRVLEINAGERWVRVQPGCVLDELNAELKAHGLHFPLDISTSNRATIGGMLANNSSGTRSVVYGKTIDHVLELKVALADSSPITACRLSRHQWHDKCAQQDQEGACYRVVDRLATQHCDEIERRFPKLLRRVGGYNLDRFTDWRAGSVSDRSEALNLAHLFVGSEGTLGVVLEAKLNLVPLPRHKAVLVAQFAHLLDALAATPAILAHGPSAVEVIDKYVLDSTKINAEASRLRDFLDGDPGAILIIEFFADRAEDLSPKLAGLEADLRQRGHGSHWLQARDATTQGRIWKLRKLSLGLSMAEKGDAKALSFVEDTAVAPERLRDYIAEFLQAIERHGTSAGVYAHASVGCLHVRPIVNLKTEEGVRKFEALAADVADLVLKYGGALSGEHGDGLVRSPFQAKMFGPVLYEAFREIKRTFDPLNILNPGKIVDAPPLTSNLRYGPKYLTPDVPTTFDFSADGGLVRAAELCVGVGECRKKREGTMCPSYQATREEQHSTRGRANVLRLALTGQLGLQGMTDPAVKEALDLCLECKACKSECPTNTDMARLKAEFLHQWQKKHGVPWRNWIFGNVGEWGRRACGAPGLFNWLSRGGLGRWVNDRLFGIDRRRLPPKLAWRSWTHDNCDPLFRDPDPYPHWAFLFPDTFMNYFEPGLGNAVLTTLRRLQWGLELGFRQELGAHHLACCGRPLISNGLLDEAVIAAKHNVAYLYPWVVKGWPIIACEPSCTLTIKDDYPALLEGELRKKAEIVAAACLTFEEFTESILASGGRKSPGDGVHVESPARTGGLTSPARLAFRPGPKKILVQPHCHQRSLVGAGPLMNLLRRIPGAAVIDLDAGCCGMAGSFGYEKEHYEISRLVGEQRLFPAIRAAAADTAIVAPGFSCRMQIEHFTGRKAVHPAELLFSLLDGPSS